MKIMKLLRNNSGASMLQVMVLGAAIAGAGAYMLQGVEQQNKIVRTATSRGAFGVMKRELSEALADSVTCEQTLQWGFANEIKTGTKNISVGGIIGMVGGT